MNKKYTPEGAMNKKYILSTAFLEGLSVLIIEIAGARAIAPFYGTSLRVWTSQITATLLFLALGYGLGGRLSRVSGRWNLPSVFWGAGIWLGFFPWIRPSVLTVTALVPGVALGSLLAASVLFGPPLLCLGAVSPLLIQRLQEGDRGGAAAGGIFFTNTLGGLAGGWLTALVLIPHVPLRVILAATGLTLALLGSVWAWNLRKPAVALVLPVILFIGLLAAPKPALSVAIGGEYQGMQGVLLYSKASCTGLVQVLDIQKQGLSQGIILMLDGINQGGMEKESGLSIYPFMEYLSYLSWSYHPQAKRALILGLGPGLLAKQLVTRGLDVDVVEIEPRMQEVAKKFFGLPANVRVHLEDGRSFLNRSQEKWDLIYMDCFAGENAPWYLLTTEGMGVMHDHLSPGGRLLVNTVTQENGSPGLARIEAGLMQVFPQVEVFVSRVNKQQIYDVVNACLVAGADLKPVQRGYYNGKMLPYIEQSVKDLLPRRRLAQAGAVPPHDDLTDLEAVDADFRLVWRRETMFYLSPQLLGN
jgi:spermidine synthase